MNRLILLSSDLQGKNHAILKGRRAEHIRSVLKTKVGDSIRFGQLNGPIGIAKLVRKDDSELLLELEYSAQAPVRPIPCTLVMALPRPKVARRLIQAICSLGVEELHLINTYRVEKSFWQSHYLEEAQLQHQLILGLEQSGSTTMPEVFQHRLFRPFAEDRLPEILQNKMGLIAHPYAEKKCPVGIDTPSVLIVGPEGGFTEFEVNLLANQGAIPVSMGNRILRVETAVPALLGRLYSLD